MPDKLKTSIVVISLFSLFIVTGSCKKLELLAGGQSALEKYFEKNVLNNPLFVTFASDSTVDITKQFADYNFVLTKDTSYYNGNMTGTKNGITYYGTWVSNSDYGKLTINFTNPSLPKEFIFLNREWKFTKKEETHLELAPWGSPEPKILHINKL